MSVLLEVCVETVEGACIASTCGAARLELCAALDCGGLTPSLGLVSAVLESVTCPVNVLIRPRAGHFVFSDAEIAVMRRDILAFKECGINGVVIGCLTSAGDIDEQATRSLVEASLPLHVTFHRAIDQTQNPLQALQKILQIDGIDRVLTSGGAQSASAGSGTIAQLVKVAGSRVTIMAGAGISAAGVRELVQHTGVREVHGSLSDPASQDSLLMTDPAKEQHIWPQWPDKLSSLVSIR